MRILVRYLLPILLPLTHSVLVGWMYCGIRSSSDPEAAWGWLLFYYVDWPSSIVLFPAGDGVPYAIYVLCVGGMHWFVVGCLLQLPINVIGSLIWRRLSQRKLPSKRVAKGITWFSSE
jgi:hypothetical protein